MKKLIFLLLISTGSTFAQDSPPRPHLGMIEQPDISELADQVKWRGLKSEQGLNNKILFHTVRNNFPGFCCCRGNFSVENSAEDYLKQHVLHLGGVPLAQNPRCEEIYAAVAQKHRLKFDRYNNESPISALPTMSLMLSCQAVAMYIAKSYFIDVVSECDERPFNEKIAVMGLSGLSAGILVLGVSTIPCVNGTAIRNLRLRGNLDGIKSEESSESKKDR